MQYKTEINVIGLNEKDIKWNGWKKNGKEKKLSWWTHWNVYYDKIKFNGLYTQLAAMEYQPMSVFLPNSIYYYAF